MRWLITAITLAIAAGPALADDYDRCVYLLNEWNDCRSRIFREIEPFIRCLGSADPDDDCQSQFSNLKYAWERYENSVDDLEYPCAEYRNW